MKTLSLVAKHNKPEAVVYARQIKERYPQCTVLAERHLAEALGWPPLAEEAELCARADLVVVLGGDGTLIKAARMLGGRPVPILGINLGSLGFLTEVPEADLFPMLDTVIAGTAKADARMKLSVRLFRDGKVLIEDEVLNDVVINKGALARIADHETSINGKFVTLYKSDGVIVSTPTGSTAYSLSANGPIVHPASDCIILTPICPHALTQRPIVVTGEQVVSILLKSDSTDVYLTIDGQVGLALKQGDKLEVKRSPNRVFLVRNPAMDYFAILRQKLHWGER
ncbi:MAG: NAD(+)/NADH kinase [Myxococcaceae bacterium]